jgi:uncharacterized protein (DUF488 family)
MRHLNTSFPSRSAGSRVRTDGAITANRIFTFGYEGLSLDVFIARLTAAGVKTVIDVRANPLSRKPGFSKRGLATALNEAGLAYVHMPVMGCPKPVRDRYRQDGNWSAYTRSFLAYLKGQAQSITALAQSAKASPSCLICFEADFERCHRTFVARAVAADAGLRVTHLTDRTEIPDGAVRSAA